MLLSMTSCSLGFGIEDECEMFSAIYPSRLDTIETRRQIYEHDRIGQEKCGWVGFSKA